jgi:predicted ester cyclase
MSTEENKNKVRAAFDEFISNGDLSNAAEYVAPDYNGYFTGGFPPIQGVEAFKQFVTVWVSAFSERQVTIEDIVAEGDKVALRTTFRGTHTGELNGIPPTGRQVEVTALNIFRIVNGKAVEQRVVNDDLGMLQQLGLAPAPGQ